jgi:hypothetical protein
MFTSKFTFNLTGVKNKKKTTTHYILCINTLKTHNTHLNKEMSELNR